jgi:hypothetical protein
VEVAVVAALLLQHLRPEAQVARVALPVAVEVVVE